MTFWDVITYVLAGLAGWLAAWWFEGRGGK